ncbi:ankyrin repeat protein [Teratosphaeria destructans]|uniref:Ankyrin repeat protein n=1 Tax=Teratosphaeria destructans TaxID=418781 RepID=A0A9W7VYZ8_9PEZI|nr:ankyrin repeat protein [Teratosphaeria destructans]
MDDFPHFIPISSVPSPASETDAILVPTNAKIAAAETECSRGDSLKASASIDELIQEGTPVQNLKICLRLALQSGNKDLVQKLLRLGVPIATSTICAAVDQKSLESMSLLFEYGWDVNEELEWCYPGPLSDALKEDADESVVNWFLSHGADPDKMCQMDTTPFSTAVQYAPIPILKLLFSHTSYPRHGQLLHHAARRTSDDCCEVMKRVLDRYRVDVNMIMYEDHAFSFEMHKCLGLGTPLHEAAKYGRPEVARVLLDQGADINILDSCGQTALAQAEISGNYAILDLLRYN